MEWMVKPKEEEGTVTTECMIDCGFFCPVELQPCSKLGWCAAYIT